MNNRLNPALLSAQLAVMNFLNEVTARYPSALSLAPGRPRETFFEVDRVHEQLDRYATFRAEQEGASPAAIRRGLGQYGRTNGIIQDLIARHLAVDEGIRVSPAAIIVTVGAQEAMSLVLQGTFDREHDVLLVTEPNYIGMTGAATILGIRVAPVAMLADGIDLQDLRATYERVSADGLRPKALYDIPDFHNPSGTRLPLARRHELLDVAAHLDLDVIEDNPYGLFVYEGERLPTLKALDRERRVLYIGTFAKALFPGLRVGWLVADQEVTTPSGSTTLASELSKVKSLTTVNTSPLAQAVAGGFLLDGEFSLRHYTAAAVQFYAQNRDRMLNALERHFGAGTELHGHVRWNRPQGGFFIVVRLPFVWTADDVHACAEEQGLIVCPMSFFYLRSGGTREIRLSFSYISADMVDTAIERLSAFVRRAWQERRIREG